MCAAIPVSDSGESEDHYGIVAFNHDRGVFCDVLAFRCIQKGEVSR